MMLNMVSMMTRMVLRMFSSTLGFKLTYKKIFTTFCVSASKFNYRGSSLKIENDME